MALYHFTLTLSGVSYQTAGLEDALYQSGCDDGLICAYGQSVYIDFSRQAISLDSAIESAIDNIESAGVGAVVKSVDSALVGLSDIAEMTGMSRQAIALLKDGSRGKGNFPCPVQRIKGQSPLWDWAEVAHWLHASGRLENHDQQLQNALVLGKWNLALQNSAFKEINEVEHIAQRLRARRQKDLLPSN